MTLILDYNEDRTLHRQSGRSSEEEESLTELLVGEEPRHQATVYIQAISRVGRWREGKITSNLDIQLQ